MLAVAHEKSRQQVESGGDEGRKTVFGKMFRKKIESGTAHKSVEYELYAAHHRGVFAENKGEKPHGEVEHPRLRVGMGGEPHRLVGVPKRLRAVAYGIDDGIAVGEKEIVEIVDRGVEQITSVTQQTDNQEQRKICKVGCATMS